MIKFNVLTIFPDMFPPYLGESIMARAIKNKKIAVKTVDIRKFTKDNHRTVDEKPYGGGAGMLMKIEPIYKAVQSVTRGLNASARGGSVLGGKRSTLNARIVLFSAKGKQFTQKDAARLSKYDNLIFICGRYEGVDERVAKYIADEEISVGPYVLSGGELPALTVIDAVARMIPGVLGNPESLKEESFSFKKTPATNYHLPTTHKEYAQYTRPEVFYPNPKNKKIKWVVPKVLLGGNHAKINEWRKKNSK